MTRFFVFLFAALAFVACNNNTKTTTEEEKKDEHAGHDHEHGHDHDHHGHDHDHHHHDHSDEKGDGVHYGLTKITVDGAITADALIKKLDKKEGLQEITVEEGKKTKGLHTKVEGTISEVCQAAGCWFRFKTTDGKEVFIQMKEHKSIPKDWSGKTVVAEGDAFMQLISIEELRHYAQDKGASRDEIAKIKEPKMEYNFIAEGVALKQ